MLANEDVLRLSHELTGSGHWHVDFRDQSVFWSPEVFRMHGYDPEERQPTLAEALSMFHLDDQERVSSMVSDAIERREPFSFVARILRQDGDIRRVRAVGRVKHNEDSQPAWLFGVLQDITEEWLEQSHRRRLGRVIEQTAEIILMTDAQGHIEWANPAFTRVSGYSPNEYTGQKPSVLLQGPDTSQDTISFMRRKLELAEAFNTEVLNYSQTGRPYWIRLSCHADYDEDGRHVGFSSIQIDVTEEKNTLLQLEREVERRKAAEAEYLYLANHDSLSGLHNRRYFFEEAEKEIRRCLRYSTPVSMLFIDFDQFKAINDHYGHEAGDKVIEAFGGLCKKMLREHDLIARLGGEEFAALLPETPLMAATGVADRLREAFQQLPVSISKGTIHVTASIGVTEANPEDETVQSLINRADRALLMAKQAGRNQVVDAAGGHPDGTGCGHVG